MQTFLPMHTCTSRHTCVSPEDNLKCNNRTNNNVYCLGSGVAFENSQHALLLTSALDSRN